MAHQTKRGGPKRVTDEQIARVRDLRAAQPSRSQASIGQEVGLSVGAVNAILSPKTKSTRVEVALETIAPPNPPAEPSLEPTGDPGETDPEAERRDSLKSLRGARKLAEANKDPIRIIQAALGAAKVAGDIERSNPKPVELAKLPKTREMGAKARKRLHDLLTRMQQQAAETAGP